MTWKEIQDITLRKMFVPESEDGLYAGLKDPYLPGMAAAANEGLHLLATSGRYIQRCVQFPALQNPDGGLLRYDLRELCGDFYAFDPGQVYLRGPAGDSQSAEAQTEGDSVLWLPSSGGGTWTVYYYAYPAPVSDQTPPETVLPLHPEAAVLLPLYMASQLYKDDDAGLASLYRQEFEAGLEQLRRSALRRMTGPGQFTGLTRWW